MVVAACVIRGVSQNQIQIADHLALVAGHSGSPFSVVEPLDIISALLKECTELCVLSLHPTCELIDTVVPSVREEVVSSWCVAHGEKFRG